MSKNKKAGEPAAPVVLIPLQVKLRGEIREKLKVIAAENGLSLNDVASMCLAAGMNIVGSKLREIHVPAETAEAA